MDQRFVRIAQGCSHEQLQVNKLVIIAEFYVAEVSEQAIIETRKA